jgi:hypothetical protein
VGWICGVLPLKLLIICPPVRRIGSVILSDTRPGE